MITPIAPDRALPPNSCALRPRHEGSEAPSQPMSGMAAAGRLLYPETLSYILSHINVHAFTSGRRAGRGTGQRAGQDARFSPNQLRPAEAE